MLRAVSGLHETPDESALMAWIRRPELRASDGRVLSWINGEHPGYPYDEATALFARTFAWMGKITEAAQLGRVLDARIEADGSLGRSGQGFLFDTALALDNLSVPQPTAGFLATELLAGRSCVPIQRPGWWSESFGAHLTKACVPLLRFGRRQVAHVVAEGLADSCFDGERFHIHAESPWTYLHSHCYAVEGLLGLGIRSEMVQSAAAWLVGQQDEDGSFPAWAGGRYEARRPTDVVAQAVRIWAAVDRRKFDTPIRKALGRLASLQHPSGGIRYTEGSGDLCSWVAAFTLQACAWARQPPEASELEWLI